MDSYNVWMLLIGVACFGATWLPLLLWGKPLSPAIVFVGFGAVTFSLPLGFTAPDPIAHPRLAEHLTELVVIVALVGVGLKLDRPFSLRRWSSTWRLLGIAMPLCIAAFAFAGWSVLGLSPAAAILLGAVLAPTDPVLAASVQAAPPMQGPEDEIRFALTSESGLNDGLAFPFMNLALALAAANSGGETWFVDWIGYHVLYQVSGGLLAGVAIGYLMARLVFRVRQVRGIAQAGEGAFAIAMTLISYGTTNLLQANGFLAVFATALTFRQYKRDHEYHKALHKVSENVEQLLMAVILVLFGGALASGLLAPLTWQAAVAGLAFVFIVRPLAGIIGLAGTPLSFRQKAAMAFFGIRGIDSLYILAYALNQEDFVEAKLLWATVAFVVLVSIVVHGITATAVMNRVGE